jgi:hypothetical protein
LPTDQAYSVKGKSFVNLFADCTNLCLVGLNANLQTNSSLDKNITVWTWI